MPQIDIVVSNKLGLHARAAAKLTQLAGQFKSDIHIAKGAKRVNAKSIMGVMMLAAGMGSTVTVDAVGDDDGANRDVEMEMSTTLMGQRQPKQERENEDGTRRRPSSWKSMVIFANRLKRHKVNGG